MMIGGNGEKLQCFAILFSLLAWIEQWSHSGLR